MAGATNSGDWPEAGTGWKLGIINLKVHFFLGVREFFVLHRMVGSTRRGVLTPGYFEPGTFPSLGSLLCYCHLALLCVIRVVEQVTTLHPELEDKAPSLYNWLNDINSGGNGNHSDT